MTDMQIEPKKSKSKKGGAMPGSGRPKGRLNKTTLEAMEVKREYLDKVRRNADQLFNAQFSVAKGTQMLFVIKTDSKGNRRKPEIVTDPEIISNFLEENEGMDGSLGSDDSEYFFLTTRSPDSRTISDMLDRAIGKPEQQLDLTTKGESINPYASLTVEELKKLAGK